MKRSLLALTLASAFAASLAGAAVVPTVKTAKVGALGPVVVSANGRTLYHYLEDGHGKVSCSGACAREWPPLLVKAGAKPVAGTGVSAGKLGLVKRSDGALQVTYGGLALYRFGGDAKPGDANGQGLESEWYAVSPAARVVKAPASTAATSAPAAASSSSTPPTSSSSSGGGGYDYGD